MEVICKICNGDTPKYRQYTRHKPFHQPKTSPHGLALNICASIGIKFDRLVVFLYSYLFLLFNTSMLADFFTFVKSFDKNECPNREDRGMVKDDEE